MNVNFYTFAKKKNSTARPSSNPTTYACIVKEGCSVMAPAIGLDIGRLTSPSQYNYAYISDFNRYYYIEDWYWEKGLWWATMSVDILASFKTIILQNTAYVSRASKTYDGLIMDSLYPSKSNFYNPTIDYWGNSSTQTVNTPWTNSPSGGFYVVGIINKDTSSVGAVSYYAFNSSQFAVFKGILLGDTTWTGIMTTNPDIGENLYKSLFNPFQYITSILWFPFSLPTGWGTQINILDIGWWEISGVYCTRLTMFRCPITGSFRVTEHPQSSSRGRYLNSAPYSEYRAFFPPFGQFELEASKIVGYEFTDGYLTLGCNIEVDLITGTARLIIFLGNNELVHCTTQLAVQIQLAQIYSENTKEDTINKLINTGVSAVKELVFGAEDGGVLNSGVLDALSVGEIHFSQTGTNGSFAQFADYCFAVSLHHVMADDALADKGRPLCQEKLLSTLSPGYVMTIGAHIQIAGTEQEIRNINNALDRGVYLE
jgi:hypothetical protein